MPFCVSSSVIVRSVTVTSLPRDEEERAKLKREKVRVPTCLTAVIATTELNRNRTGTKGDERREKEENRQEEEAGLRPACESDSSGFPSLPPCIPRQGTVVVVVAPRAG